MPPNNDLSCESVRNILDYDPQTGFLRWKFNSDRAKEWNTRRAGKIAGGPSGANGAVAVRLDKLYLAHRLAWLIFYGKWPREEIDHINGIPSDNRLINLREASHGQNSLNRGRQSNNSSGFKGIRFRAHHKKWEGRIHLHGQQVWQGYFDSAQEAAAARRDALSKIHGEFTPDNPDRARHIHVRKAKKS